MAGGGQNLPRLVVIRPGGPEFAGVNAAGDSDRPFRYRRSHSGRLVCEPPRITVYVIALLSEGPAVI
jgi:hypothetical protein